MNTYSSNKPGQGRLAKERAEKKAQRTQGTQEATLPASLDNAQLLEAALAVLPRFLRERIQVLCEGDKRSPGGVFAAHLYAMAAATGARISIKDPEWGEIPGLALYLAIIGPASSGKSPSMNTVRKGLWKVEQAMLEKGVGETQEGEAGEGYPPCLDIGEFSEKGLADYVRNSAYGSLGTGVIADELASILALDAKGSGGISARWNFLTVLYTSCMAPAGVYAESRKKNGGQSFLPPIRTALSLLGGIQPSYIPAMFGNGREEGGIISRFLFVNEADRQPVFLKYSERYGKTKNRATDYADEWEYFLVSLSKMRAVEMEIQDTTEVGHAKDAALEPARAVSFDASYTGKQDYTVNRIAALMRLLRAREEGELFRIQKGEKLEIGPQDFLRAVPIMAYFYEQARQVYAMAAPGALETLKPAIRAMYEALPDVFETAMFGEIATRQGVVPRTWKRYLKDHTSPGGASLWEREGHGKYRKV